MDCIFCKIIENTLSAKILYQDDLVLAFDDLYPKAQYHKLIIPRKHIATLNDLTVEDKHIGRHMLFVAQQLAKELNIAEEGYRIVMNCNKGGGQVIYHIHLHLLGGHSLPTF